MYDESVKDPCRWGLAEHQGEQICVLCGAVWNEETQSWDLPAPKTTNGEDK